MSKVTPSEFIQQVWDVEHIKLHLGEKWFEGIIFLDSYPYTTPISGEVTVDEFLATRIQPILENAVQWQGSTTIM